jgi:hypothetical protein
VNSQFLNLLSVQALLCLPVLLICSRVHASNLPADVLSELNNCNIVWLQDYLSRELQGQTNSLDVGLGINWVTILGSESTNQMTIPIDSIHGNALFGLG